MIEEQIKLNKAIMDSLERWEIDIRIQTLIKINNVIYNVFYLYAAISKNVNSHKMVFP